MIWWKGDCVGECTDDEFASGAETLESGVDVGVGGAGGRHHFPEERGCIDCREGRNGGA